MTALDPYPAELLEELPATAPDPLVNAITRLAQAIETLAAQTRTPAPPVVAAGGPPSLAPLPPVQTPQTPDPTFDGCPIHHAPWKVVPAGVSKKTGRAYEAFKACPVAGCDQRPAR